MGTSSTTISPGFLITAAFINFTFLFSPFDLLLFKSKIGNRKL